MRTLTHAMRVIQPLVLVFRQILEEDDNADYLVLGISQGGNTQALFNYAKEKDIQFVYADELLHQVSPH